MLFLSRLFSEPAFLFDGIEGGKMYFLKTEQSFDSAHFLAGYNGKCRNIHGHRWTIKMEVCGKNLENEGHLRGMLVDFGDIKRELKELADYFDHSLIVEKGSMREVTLNLLKEDGFRVIEIDFRPTAENFSKYIFDYFKEKGLNVKKVTVYETPNNCATYREEI